MYKFLFWIWAIFILGLCSIPGKEIPKFNFWDHTDKIVHIILFAILAYLYRRQFRFHIIGVLLMVLYGFAIEWYQGRFISGRSFDLWDGVADVIGIGLGLLIFHRFKLRS